MIRRKLSNLSSIETMDIYIKWLQMQNLMIYFMDVVRVVTIFFGLVVKLELSGLISFSQKRVRIKRVLLDCFW